MNSNFQTDIFIMRFAELKEAAGETNKDLQEIFGLSLSAVINYQTGKRTPDIAFLHKLAEHYHVSADYLLGLSDVKSTEQDMKIACEVTGLSEKAIDNIKSTYYCFPRLEREGTKHALSTNSIYGEREREACEEYMFAHSALKQRVAVSFLESESFERIVHRISEACEKKEKATTLMTQSLIENVSKQEHFEMIKCAYEANAQYKASILDTYELIKDFVESYTNNLQEMTDNVQHHETEE